MSIEQVRERPANPKAPTLRYFEVTYPPMDGRRDEIVAAHAWEVIAGMSSGAIFVDHVWEPEYGKYVAYYRRAIWGCNGVKEVPVAPAGRMVS